MSVRDEGGPAFPILPPLGPDGMLAVGYPFVSAGASLRDMFAGMAMMGMCADATIGSAGTMASLAYGIADAMLEARKV
jgi:hypothetical protein